jgi:hypothetical protein
MAHRINLAFSKNRFSQVLYMRFVLQLPQWSIFILIIKQPPKDEHGFTIPPPNRQSQDPIQQAMAEAAE